MKWTNTTNGRKRVTLIRGDGIGPEVAEAAVQVIAAAGAPIDWCEAEAGANVFERGVASGITKATIDCIKETHVVLKGPLETPVGFGGKSVNVTLRKLFETYANVRPVKSLPNIDTPFKDFNIDLVVVRENVEDLYAGIEHMQTPGVSQCLKLISDKGCEKISRLAFEYAVAENRKMVTCATKANIMKLTEGMLKRVFERVAKEYPNIESNHMIIDNCAHQLVIRPDQFDVIVASNMNGDIISDLTSGLVGGLGLAPSMNLGNDIAIFEAVHGSAPDIAGQNKANPTALLLSAVMMLKHLHEFEAAEKIEQAILLTLEQGDKLTGDLAKKGAAVGTKEFTERIIENLGKDSKTKASKRHAALKVPIVSRVADSVRVENRHYDGLDLFIESGFAANALGKRLEELVQDTKLKLKMISNRGTKVYPSMDSDTDMVDHWRCRFIVRDSSDKLTDQHIVELINNVGNEFRWMHIEKLLVLDGEAAYSKAQGED